MLHVDVEPLVYIVDDDAGMRKSLELVLASDPVRVVSCPSAEVFLDRFDCARSGCVILDLRLERIGGFELFEHLRQRCDGIPVIFLTGHGDVEQAVEAMKRGAFDFLEKPVDPWRLHSRVREAIEQWTVQRAQNAERLTIREHLDRLTVTERSVLEGLVRGETSEEIATRMHRSRRTVDNHRLHILRKMKAGNTAELVRKVMLVEPV